MHDQIQAARAALETELEALDQQRSDLEAAIRALDRLVGEPVSTPAPVAKKNGRTDGRTDARRAPVARSLPDGADDHAEAILKAITKAGGSIGPGKLAAALHVTLGTVARWVEPLVKARTLVVTGDRRSKRISLPGKVPGKEVP